MALLQHVYDIAVRDGGQAMRDEYGGAVLSDRPQGVEDVRLGQRVQRGRGLVAAENPGRG